MISLYYPDCCNHYQRSQGEKSGIIGMYILQNVINDDEGTMQMQNSITYNVSNLVVLRSLKL